MARPRNTTEAECKFITWLGCGVFAPAPIFQGRPEPRIETLNRYRLALGRRVRWDGIDRHAVLQHLDREIAGELVRAA